MRTTTTTAVLAAAPVVRVVPAGPAATAALVAAIEAAKGGDPLGPVTVVAPASYPSLFLRRGLAAGGGLVGVGFMALARLAELVGGPLLARRGKRPLPTAERAEAVRAALLERPGPFQRVAHHPATARAMDTVVAEVAALDAVARAELAGRGIRARQVVGVVEAAMARAGQASTAADQARAAAEAVLGNGGADGLGHVIAHLPCRMGPADLELVDALAAVGRLSVVVGLTGDADADAPGLALASRLGWARPNAVLTLFDEPADDPVSEAKPPLADEVVVANDPDLEARMALARVMEAADGGVPLHRIAVVSPPGGPHRRIVHEHLSAAGIPHSGPPVTTLADSMAGRTLLRLLALSETGWSREAVMGLLAGAPITWAPRGAPRRTPDSWEAMARDAHVVAGREQWRPRLLRWARSSEWADPEAVEQSLAAAAELADFVEDLAARTDPDAVEPETWGAWSAWAAGLLEHYLPHPARRGDWPEAERHAAEQVGLLVRELGRLDRARGAVPVGLAELRSAAERLLAEPGVRIGPAGTGVFVGRTGDVAGGDFELVIVLGMAEGVAPARRREDPFLPDHLRSGLLRTRADRAADDRRAYLLALAAGRRRVVSFARRDVAGSQERRPSRWLLESAAALADVDRMQADTLLGYGGDAPWRRRAPSLESVLLAQRLRMPVSEQERNLSGLLQWKRSGGVPEAHPLAALHPSWGRGLDAIVARASDSVTVWDGRVGPVPGLVLDGGRPKSATALETYAECPWKYFLRQVLGVHRTERPDDALALEPLDRGTLVHAALERFLDEAEARTGPDHRWSADDVDRMAALVDELCDTAVDAGLVRPSLMWDIQRRTLGRRMRALVGADSERRAADGVVPAAWEARFGTDGIGLGRVEAVTPAGRRIPFRGKVDRIDVSPDGSRVVVLDYKTGKADKHRKVAQDPLNSASLQLPIYGLAARHRWPDAEVEAGYWLVDDEGMGFRRYTAPITPELEHRFGALVDAIADGIEGGMFAAEPGPERWPSYDHCYYCEFDRICAADRGEARQRKAGDEAYLALGRVLAAPDGGQQ